MSRENKVLKIFLDEDYTNVSDSLTIPSFEDKYIDHILINNKFILKDVHVDNAKNYPSDHFPIIAKIQLKSR